jgi:uncharacterized membrane protein YccC
MKRIFSLPLLTSLREIATYFSHLKRLTPRTVDELEAALSVIVTIVCAHLLGEKNIGSAAFSAYMVMRAHFTVTLRRGMLRVLGTVIGAALACAYPAQLTGSPVCIAVAMLVAGTITLYGALTEESGYAWLFAGITFCMVLTELLQDPGAELRLFALSRVM